MDSKTQALLVFAGMSALGAGALAWADDPSAGPPPGTYRLSCYNAAVDGDALKATCQTFAGNYRPAALPKLSQCENVVLKGGDIANINGNLVCVPDLPQATAETFPQPETTINRWVYSGDDASIHRHGWAIWAGLTTFTGTVDGSPVRAFETWTTPSNMIFRTQSGLGLEALQGRALLQKAQLIRPAARLELSVPNQFRHVKRRSQADEAAAAGDGDTNIFVGVAYNPAAAQHAIANKLFLQSTLNGYLRQGYTQLPVFPSSAITIKPVYKIVQKNEANGNVKNGIYTMPGWPGTPSPAVAFPEQDWNACVYVNIAGSGQGGSSIDPGCGGQTQASTFYLDDFVHHVIAQDEVAAISQQTGMQVSAGDIALLVGMHVTTREATRWTWQTYWWSANADQPYPPSSGAIAATRPPVLDRAARHYAMAVAYQMVSPAQPINGGKSVGAAVYAYNPHLEAGFDPGTFQIAATIDDNGTTVTNQYGVQTNCMSCHGLAQYQSTPGYYKINGGANRQTPYAADFYFSLDDPLFAGHLQLDFAWSILGNLVLDDDGQQSRDRQK